MKFIKGLMVGSLITTGVMTTKKITKKGKKWARKMGMI